MTIDYDTWRLLVAILSFIIGFASGIAWCRAGHKKNDNSDT